MLTQADKSKLRQLVQSPQWVALELLAKELCDKLNDEQVIRDTEWDTIKSTIMREGQVRGVKALLGEIINNIHDQA